MQAANVVADLQSDPLTTQVVIPSEHHARVLSSLAPDERRTLVNQLGALEQFSTRELHQAAHLLKATIQARPPAPRTPPPAPAPINPLDSDDRIEQGLAEHLPWMDLEIDLGITSPPYCLGLAIPYDEGGDYDDYDSIEASYFRDGASNCSGSRTRKVDACVSMCLWTRAGLDAETRVSPATTDRCTRIGSKRWSSRA